MRQAPSFRAQLITRRTYNRPLDEEGTRFETWEQTVDRVIDHQQWLWMRAKDSIAMSLREISELEQLRELMLDRKVSVSGRTLWLGGTDVAKTREASQFNCAHSEIETVYDNVDPVLAAATRLWHRVYACPRHSHWLCQAHPGGGNHPLRAYRQRWSRVQQRGVR